MAISREGAKAVAIFVGGFVTGATVAGVILKQWFQKKFDEELEEEVACYKRWHEADKEAAKDTSKKASRTRFKAPLSQVSDSSELEHGEEYKRALESVRESYDERDREGVEREKTDLEQQLEDDEALAVFEHEEVMRARLTGEGQIEISEDEFVENQWEYNKLNLLYFTVDEVLCDEAEERLVTSDYLDPEWFKIWEERSDPAFFIVDHDRERVLEIVINIYAYNEWHEYNGGFD